MKRASIVRKGWGWRIMVIGTILLFQGFQDSVGLAAGDTSMAAKALPSSEPGIAPGWLAFHPDAPLSFSNMSQHSLRLSPLSGNFPQIVYGGDHLYYAYQDAGGWHTQTADSAWGVGSGAALALDANGKAHISYYDTANRDLKYATNRYGAWVTETVVSSGEVGRYSDIAIDAWGDPAIVYFNATTSELHYIYFDSGYGDWGPDEVVAAADDVYHPGWFSFALDTSVTPNRPHVSYYERSSNTLGEIQWAHYNASSVWTQEWIETSCVSTTDCKLGEYNSIALDPTTHRPAIAYSYRDAEFTFTLMYTTFNGSSWDEDWYVPASVPTFISLAIDSSSHPYLSWSENGFKYAYRSAPDTWASTTLDASTTAGQWSSLALVGTLAKVVHYDSASGIYEYIGHERTGWLTPVTIATQGHDVGSCTSLAVDGLGRSHISYFDNTSKTLLYARYNGDGSWFMNTIGSTVTASCFSVMAVNPVTNVPFVGFIRGGSLWYSAGTSWLGPLEVDTGVSAGYNYQTFGLALASNGVPHFAYVKGSDLWYAIKAGTTWSRTKLVTGPVGSQIALALGPDDQPHIAYYQSGELKYTRYNGSWSTAETVASNGSSGSGVGVALAVNPAGQPMIAFLSAGGNDLRVSTRLCLPICSWSPGLLLDDYAEEQFSLAIDRRGTPHLATMALVSGQGFQLHYITRQGGAWSVLAVDTNDGIGWYPSIGLTSAGTPRISYSDTFSDDLKFVLKFDKIYLPLLKK